MVCQWGMSDLGPISFGTNNEVFLGRDFVRERDYSEKTASEVDVAIHTLLDEAYADTKELVTEHRKILDAIAEDLMERETMEATRLDEIIRANGGAHLIPEPPKKKERIRRPVQPETTPKAVKDEEPDVGGTPPGDVVPGTA